MPDSSASVGFGFGTPFEAQLAFFRDKLKLGSLAWDDITGAQHDRAFIVAGAMKAQLLTDLQNAIAQAMANGKGMKEFQKEFPKIAARNGWTGWTGEGTPDGVAWRASIIYDTNVSTSYAAGRFRQMSDPAYLKLRPYWRYNHADGVLHPRPLHQAWNGVTLRYDHSFWRTHYAPNGWRCHCWVNSVAKPGPADKTAPPEGWDAVNPKTGEQPGIDKGFGYTPGATWHPDLDKYTSDIAKAVVAENLKDGVLDRWVQQTTARVTQAAKEFPDLKGEALSNKLRQQPGVVLDDKMAVAVLDAKGQQALGVQTQAVWLSDDTLVKQAVHRTGQDLPVGGYTRLQEILDAALYVQTDGDSKLIYYQDGADVAVAVVKATQDKQELWLVSLRRSSQRELNAAIKSGKATPW